MIKITDKIANQLMELNGHEIMGYFCDYGAVIGDAQYIIVDQNNGYYLAHISEFEESGVLVRLKKENKT